MIGRVCFEVLTLKREGDDVIDALKVTFQFFFLSNVFFFLTLKRDGDDVTDALKAMPSLMLSRRKFSNVLPVVVVTLHSKYDVTNQTRLN